MNNKNTLYNVFLLFMVIPLSYILGVSRIPTPKFIMLFYAHSLDVYHLLLFPYSLSTFKPNLYKQFFKFYLKANL